ncbi:sigma-54 factor interaction domain-containing protein, partial [Vibrio parahaemolyticus]|nr:sigma-54 factor interaction domain-containing protein [Vibrio parahaemolyticus]
MGSSQTMKQVYRTIDSAASSKESIFITGESGTGKEVCAEAIHAASKLGHKPFIA